LLKQASTERSNMST